MRSVIQSEKYCFLCGFAIPFGCYDGLESHHIFFGSNRKKSEKYGLKVWLCGETCHRNGKKAVHKNRETDLYLKRIGQEAFESCYGDRADFIREFGKSYI